MVDCGNARCAQERRNIKRELLSWTKKVPLLIGLEEVSKSLCGKRRMRKILEPFNCLERSKNSEPNDWEPQDVCVFCTTKTKFMTKVMKQIEDDGVQSATSQHLMDMFPRAYDYLPPDPPEEEVLPVDYNAPLDLSATSKRSASPTPKVPAFELKIPSMDLKFSRKKDGKRQYTEQELHAAVADIRSGKLGTRRASNLYGIPRSTLRNKIFRMENYADENSAKDKRLSMKDIIQHDNNNGDDCIDLSMNGSHDWSHDEWEAKLEQARHKHDLDAGHERPFGMPPLFFNSNYMVECERAFSLSNPFSYDAKLPFLHDLVRKFAEQRMQLEREVQGLNPAYSLDLSFSPKNDEPNDNDKSLSPNHVDLKVPSYKPLRNVTMDTEEPTSSDSDPVSSKINENLKDIISRSISDRLKSRTAHPTLPYDFLGGLSFANGLGGIGGYLPTPLDAGIGRSGSVSPAKRQRIEPKATKASGDSAVQVKTEPGEKPAKKTRPKRGQYRKYNHELLMEAVRAVQRGEMSVHRAGSYYGVPHSTLEYKVKERHLLRQKKPREPRGKKSANEGPPTQVPLSNGNSSSSDTPPTIPQPETSQTLKLDDPSSKIDTPSSSVSLDPLSGYSMAAAAAHLPMGFGWPPVFPGMAGFGLPESTAYPTYGPPVFGLNTSASDLLKKLQKKVQAKTSPISDDGSDTASNSVSDFNDAKSPETSLTVN